MIVCRSSVSVGKYEVYKDLIKYAETPYKITEGKINDFVNDMEPFMDHKYYITLEKYEIMWDYKSMMIMEVDKIFNVDCILALLTGVIRMERFSEGTLKEFFESRRISEWIKRLEDIL